MSANPTVDRDWALARIALALGRSGFDVAECDAIMAWLQATQQCAACNGRGRSPQAPTQGTLPDFLARFDVAQLSEDDHFLAQGICLACRGRGFTT